MNQVQYERALKAVREDCEGAYHLIDSAGRTCALGGMALAVGYTPTGLRRLNTYDGIARKYGLGGGHAHQIYRANDSENGVAERRIAVANVLHTFAAAAGLVVKPEGAETWEM